MLCLHPCVQWHPIMRGGMVAGELLATFEVVEMMDIDDFPLPNKRVVVEGMTRARRAIVPIPRGIRPQVRCYWGYAEDELHHPLALYTILYFVIVSSQHVHL